MDKTNNTRKITLEIFDFYFLVNRWCVKNLTPRHVLGQAFFTIQAYAAKNKAKSLGPAPLLSQSVFLNI